MRIIKKSEIKEQTCECCNSVLEVKHKDLKFVYDSDPVCYGLPLNSGYTKWRCPLCHNWNRLDTSSKETYKGD